MSPDYRSLSINITATYPPTHLPPFSPFNKTV